MSCPKINTDVTFFLRWFKLANRYSYQLRAGVSGAGISMGREVSPPQNAHNIFGDIALYSTYARVLSQEGQYPEREIPNIQLVSSLRMAETIFSSLQMPSYSG